MTGQYFLSDILTDTSRLKPHLINLIKSNVGSGKSTFALEELPKHAQSNYCMLYLTDNNMNKDQVLTHNSNTAAYTAEWRKFINNNTKIQIIESDPRNKKIWGVCPIEYVSITIMTYAKVGAILYYGHPFDWSKFDFIVCDELDNLINYSRFTESGTPNILQFTIDKIKSTLSYPDVKIIGMTATPYNVYKEFINKTCDILTNNEINSLKMYEVKKCWSYKDYGKVLLQIPKGHKGIIYFDRIRQVKKAEEILIEKGHRTGSFWSLHNTNHPMTQCQKDLRNYIIDNQMMPPDIDILLINGACKTGVNIRNEDITFMIIHAPMLHFKNNFDMPSDTLTQVRGRVRNDLRTLFYLDKACADFVNPVPPEYLDRELTAEDKEKLCGEIRYMKPNGRDYYKWGYVSKYLTENGYTIQDIRRSQRYSIISEA